MPRSAGRKPPRLRSVAHPKQARSEATLHRLLDAAELLIQDKGLADVSIPDIVARAGSSVGGFYARFKDKDELLRALEERFLAQMRDLVDGLSAPARWEDASIADIVRTGVATLLAVFQEHRPLLAAFMERAAHGQGPELQDILGFRREVSARFVELLHSRHEELAHPDPEVAIDLAIQVLFGLMQQLIVFGEVRVGERRLGEDELATELARIVLHYIGYSEGAAVHPDQTK
ncbi:MAG: TetR/AcrR family transcriptional regulator [Deltaproteobacteria bacterium]|nr:TetR/AcrR family transcriptional regulator [Deltaproteobacteria bacterium]